MWTPEEPNINVAAANIEALVATFGDDPEIDDDIAALVPEALLYALGTPTEDGAHVDLFRCALPIDHDQIMDALLVFTRPALADAALLVNPAWLDLDLVALWGEHLVEQLRAEPFRWLAINPYAGGGKEFKLPPREWSRGERAA